MRSLQIPTGTTCTVEENAPTGSTGLVDISWTWGTPAIIQPGAITVVGPVTATVTNKVNRVYGSIMITKGLAGTPTGYAGTFTGTWSCDYSVGTADDKSGTWTVNGAGVATLTPLGTQIPLTSDCTVTENTGNSLPALPVPYTWKSSVVEPAAATDIPNSTPVDFKITNTAERASLELRKLVQNPNGGSAVSTDWNQHLVAQRGSDTALVFNHLEQKFVVPGNYTLSEINQLTGYNFTGVTCTSNGSNTTVTNNVVNVAAGAAVVCTLTNTDSRAVADPRQERRQQERRWICGSDRLDAHREGRGQDPPVEGAGGATGACQAAVRTYTLGERDQHLGLHAE